MDAGFVLSRGQLWVPISAGPVISPMPTSGAGPMLGFNMRLRAFDARDGSLGKSVYDLTVGTDVTGAAVISEAIHCVVERAGIVPAFRSHSDQARATNRRMWN